VHDNTAPSLVGVPPDATVQCHAVPSAPTVTATDACDASPTVTMTESSTQNADATLCGHYSYTITRTWTATDACGNHSSGSQLITVHDTVAPVITCSTNISTITTNTAGTALNYTVTATDNYATPTIACYHVSGSVFPIGMTTVL